MTGHLEVVTGPVDVLVDLDNPRTAAYVSSGLGLRALAQIDVVVGGLRATLAIALAPPQDGEVRVQVAAINEDDFSIADLGLTPWVPRDDMSGPPEVDPCACPGCGCLPGEGVTSGCVHPDGCGYLR